MRTIFKVITGDQAENLPQDSQELEEKQAGISQDQTEKHCRRWSNL